ncbi:MAG: type II secretion system F family protein [Candidatus Aenigmarchaeota archaeon]|nr:type II secretion system F family protein [Candidatus Aenigmarchaeota archaeon]
MKKIRDESLAIIILAFLGMAIFLGNFLTVKSGIVGGVAVVMVVTTPLVLKYNDYKENKEIEERFPDFLRDITQNIKTGMTVTQAIKATKDNEYGVLTPYVKKIIIKIDWAVPFERILLDFARNSTPLIKKTVSTILETYKGGGDISHVLTAAGDTIKQINKIKQERFSSVYNQMLTGYAVFFMFVGVLVILKTYLVPSLFSFGTSVSSVKNIDQFYDNTFQWLIVIEGFFSGLVVGKMAHGSIVAGLKHSMVLTIIGYGVFFLFM